MLDPAGAQMSHAQPLAFYSTQHADSEGEEARFFIWTLDGICEVLGDAADAFVAAYGVTCHGTSGAPAPDGVGGKTIREFVGDLDQRPALAEARSKLFEARSAYSLAVGSEP